MFSGIRERTKVWVTLAERKKEIAVSVRDDGVGVLEHAARVSPRQHRGGNCKHEAACQGTGRGDAHPKRQPRHNRGTRDSGTCAAIFRNHAAGAITRSLVLILRSLRFLLLFRPLMPIRRRLVTEECAPLKEPLNRDDKVPRHL